MAVSLSELISSIGNSVQDARYALERSAVELYFQGGYQVLEDQTYLPLVKTVRLPKAPYAGAEWKTLEVPITALYAHNTMALSKVDINLHLKPYDDEGKLLYDVAPNHPDDETEHIEYADLSLSFSLNDPPEGMARLNQECTKLL